MCYHTSFSGLVWVNSPHFYVLSPSIKLMATYIAIALQALQASLGVCGDKKGSHRKIQQSTHDTDAGTDVRNIFNFCLHCCDLW